MWRESAPARRDGDFSNAVEEDEEFVFRKKRKLTQEDAPEGEGTSLIPPAPAPAAAGVPAAPDAKQQEASGKCRARDAPFPAPRATLPDAPGAPLSEHAAHPSPPPVQP